MEMNTLTEWRVRGATPDDLDALVCLEETCFSEPWSRKSFEAELTGNQFSRLLVVSHPDSELLGDVVGYICVWVVFEEVRFLNLAVHPEFRRKGMAKHLIMEAIQLGIHEGCYRGLLEVRASNQSARILYQYFNFKEYATRKSYYTNPTEDAILMISEPISQSVANLKVG